MNNEKKNKLNFTVMIIIGCKKILSWQLLSGCLVIGECS